jgi:hypothetical protein
VVRFTPALKHGTLSSNQVVVHEVLGFGVDEGVAVVVAESLKSPSASRWSRAASRTVGRCAGPKEA